ncbi:MAG: SMP-30/gluconolactonase/LRE family protein [Kangiellaceae bacterium]|nr:SMP-30/gluconolactonase/LRE family protein [Kangiellaceae bacterium]
MNRISIDQLLFTLPVGNQLGEGVQWHAESQSIWWTDIECSMLYQYCVTRKSTSHYPMPDRIASFAFVDGTMQLLVALANSLALYDFDSGLFEPLELPGEWPEGMRFNDGRVDRQGRFWVGTMNEKHEVASQDGGLYVIDGQQYVHKALSDIQISNSLCWSPDGLKMYHADSVKGVIDQYDFAPTSCELSNKRPFVKSKKGNAPDGAAVDAMGGVWVAQWAGGCIVRYTALGALSLEVKLPVSQPTCVAIGGPNMDWLIVTSAKQNLTNAQLQEESLAGAVFVYQLNGVKGLSESRYLLDR